MGGKQKCGLSIHLDIYSNNRQHTMEQKSRSASVSATHLSFWSHLLDTVCVRNRLILRMWNFTFLPQNWLYIFTHCMYSWVIWTKHTKKYCHNIFFISFDIDIYHNSHFIQYHSRGRKYIPHVCQTSSTCLQVNYIYIFF